MKFKIHLHPGARVTACQLAWPLNGLAGTIGPKQSDKTVALLPKLRAKAAEEGLSELQKLRLELVCAEDKKNKTKPDNKTGNGGNDGTDASKHDQPVGGADEFFDISGEKQCEACTSYNSVDAKVCCVCLTKFQN